jgi:hypothetical protein
VNANANGSAGTCPPSRSPLTEDQAAVASTTAPEGAFAPTAPPKSESVRSCTVLADLRSRTSRDVTEKTSLAGALLSRLIGRPLERRYVSAARARTAATAEAATGHGAERAADMDSAVAGQAAGRIADGRQDHEARRSRSLAAALDDHS